MTARMLCGLAKPAAPWQEESVQNARRNQTKVALSKELRTLRFVTPTKYSPNHAAIAACPERNAPHLALPAAAGSSLTRSSSEKERPANAIGETAHPPSRASYVAEFNPVPPLPLEQLREHAERFLAMHRIEPIYRDYCGVLLNNEMWREHLASVPYERRLLLLPKCLRVESKCPAPFDEFGLLCKQCGLCSIQDLQNEAESLGYAVLVAEGSAIVMSLIQTGKIEAIVGVSCISVLERAFPLHGSRSHPGCRCPIAPGRLHRHHGRSRLGLGIHSPHE
jgi:hypothetical protein